MSDLHFDRWTEAPALCLLVALVMASPLPLHAATQTVRLDVVDADSDRPLAARVYLTSSDGTPYFFQSPDVQGTTVRYEKKNWLNADSVEYHTSVSAHPCEVVVPSGEYDLIIERGHAYLPHVRRVKVADGPLRLRVKLRRWANPSARGWYAGETHVHRTIDELPVVMAAEELNVTFPLSFWVTKSDTPPARGDKNQRPTRDGRVQFAPNYAIWPRNTEYEIFSIGPRSHTLGALFVLNHRKPPAATVPPWRPVIAESMARDANVLFDLDKFDWPFAAVLPTVAPESLYELANNHMWRTEFAFRAWNTYAPPFIIPPFGSREGGERDWIDYTLGMYYTLLNAGFHMPPSAGTASGVHPVPAGFGRVYVHLPSGFDYEKWVDALRQGRSFVTTGPLLYATADAHDPGFRFHRTSQADETGERQPIDLQAEVVSQYPISYGELILNGEPAQLLRVDNQPGRAGTYRCSLSLPVRPARSGWFALRFWEERPGGRIRFVHSAPWYVEIDGRPVRPKSFQRTYLIERVRGEIARSGNIVSSQAVAEYRDALKFYESLIPEDDSPLVSRQSRPLHSARDRDRWLENMIVHHRFMPEEIRLATGLPLTVCEEETRRWSQPDHAGQATAQGDRIRLLPYPGGRHPRRGFLEGAIDPQRETKVSLFPPWDNGGYVVVDVPEAIFSNLGLTYLAHTHVPTIWDKQGIQLEPLEWQVEADGLVMRRTLPNRIEIASRVRRTANGAQMQIELTNGTNKRLTGMRVQVCSMLKGAIGFHTQQSHLTVIRKPLVAVRSDRHDRWIVTAWEPSDRVWSNVPVPCVHSDPIFPDCEPGETVRVYGALWFYEGTNIDAELSRRREDLRRLSAGWAAVEPDRANH